MSRHIESILERLDRYEARLDVTRDQLKRLLAELVDQRIDLLKVDVKQIRKRILRGRARSTRDAQLANNPFGTGLSVNHQEYLASSVRNQQVSVPSLDGSRCESRPTVSKTNAKRSRRQIASTSAASKRQRDNQVAHVNKEEVDKTKIKGHYKINTLSLNCTESDCQVTVSTMEDLRKHLKSAHKLDPFHCFVAGCGERFKDKYMLLSI